MSCILSCQILFFGKIFLEMTNEKKNEFSLLNTALISFLNEKKPHRLILTQNYMYKIVVLGNIDLLYVDCTNIFYSIKDVQM